MAKKKSYRNYLNEFKEKIHDITPEWEEKLGKGKILIPSGLDVEKLILSTKKGELLTNDTIREVLAKKKKVHTTAAIPTGIHLKLIALTAEYEMSEGKTKITPYWRVLKPDGSINEKFPLSVEQLAKILKSEGHELIPGKGKKTPKVKSYESKIKVFK